ncbi:hypothetical protein [Achromobacter aegrifaciens]|uniref:hypothetical protein n=1 Tax=Achromobacter aegrifaciens TaxID=1287736 RepID=UPI000F7411B4|nr:hypothetical protein [Achromobacter aegrifaciens]RSF09288.1 hypothetical protein EGU54_00190 [Achromobacter aegrifaciens]
MNRPRPLTQQLEAAQRARNQYIRLYDKAAVALTESKAREAELRERCATLASALDITASILEASADPQLKASALAARALLTTAGRAPATEMQA